MNRNKFFIVYPEQGLSRNKILDAAQEKARAKNIFRAGLVVTTT